MEPTNPIPNNSPEPKKNWFARYPASAILILLVLISAPLGYFNYQKIKPLYNSFEKQWSKAGDAQEISTWKTYTNTQYGFEINIPKDWVIDVDSGVEDYKYVSLRNPELARHADLLSEDYLPPNISIYYFPKVTDSFGGPKTLEQYAKDFGLTKTTFAGEEAYEGVEGGGDSVYYQIMLDKNYHRYLIAVYNRESKEELTPTENQILATFKFIK